MRDFIKGMIRGFVGTWVAYFGFMFFINMVLGFCTDESEAYYQPIWNIFELM